MVNVEHSQASVAVHTYEREQQEGNKQTESGMQVVTKRRSFKTKEGTKKN